MKFIPKTVVLLLLISAGQNAAAEELVVEFQGTGNRTTATFEVQAPWILDWRIISDYKQMISFDLDLVDGTTGVLEGNIMNIKALQYGRNGVRMFNQGGKFRFRVNGSFVKWHFKVIELTRAEAEQYTPADD